MRDLEIITPHYSPDLGIITGGLCAGLEAQALFDAQQKGQPPRCDPEADLINDLVSIHDCQSKTVTIT